MKNPFAKENNSGAWIAAAATGLIAAGTAAWYYIKRNAAARKADAEQATEYMKPAPLLHKKRTDLHDLHTIAAD
jgi:hypothetical protein